MLRHGFRPSKPVQTLTPSEAAHAAAEGPGSAGKQPGGTEPAAGPGKQPGPCAALSAAGSVPKIHLPHPIPLGKPSHKASPAERLRRAWCRPPLLTGGPQTQPPPPDGPDAISVCVDWLNATGALDALDATRRVVRTTWPTMGNAEAVPPRKNYEFTERYPCGVEISWAAERANPQTGEVLKGGIWLSVPGAALHLLDPAGQYRLLYQVDQLQLRPTRVDLALDATYSTPTEILDRLYDGNRALEAGGAAGQAEAMGFRTMKQHDKHKSGESEGRTIEFGNRGKNGGGRQLVTYDKGREQGVAPAGHWIRWEMRFFKRGELASQAMETVLADPDHWRQKALQLILGQIDFRERNGRREKSRRPRCAWWSDFLRAVRTLADQRLAAVRPTFRIERTIHWLQTAGMPTLTELARFCSQAATVTPGQLLDAMLQPQLMADPKKAADLATQATEALRGDDPEHPVALLVAALKGQGRWQPH